MLEEISSQEMQETVCFLLNTYNFTSTDMSMKGVKHIITPRCWMVGYFKEKSSWGDCNLGHHYRHLPIIVEFDSTSGQLTVIYFESARQAWHHRSTACWYSLKYIKMFALKYPILEYGY